MIKRALTALALGAAVAVVMATGASAAVIPSASGSVVCGPSGRFISESVGGNWTVGRANEFTGTTSRFCITKTGRVGFKIDNNLTFNGKVRAFPFDGAGCAYDLCSQNTWMPVKVRNIPGNVRSSYWWSGNSSGDYNTSYDIWFSKFDQITSQDNGAELMIWLRTPPGYFANSRKVEINHKWYEFAIPWRSHNGAISWNYLQFRELGTVHQVSNLNLSAFIGWCRSHGYIQPSWWLTSIHAGYELWSGGKGLATTKFNVVK